MTNTFIIFLSLIRTKGVASAGHFGRWRKMACLAAGNAEGFTVNSSRFAHQFYRKLGFIDAGGEENRNGVISIPMRLTKEPNTTVERDARKSAARPSP